MRRRGFTLIELLVVIAIVAVLASLLMPAVGMVRDRSKALSCQNNLRMIGLSAVQFHEDSGGWCLPTSWYYGTFQADFDLGSRIVCCPSEAPGAPAPHFGINMHYITGYPPGYWNQSMVTVAKVEKTGRRERIAYFTESWPPTVYYIQPPTVFMGNWAPTRHSMGMNVLWFSGRTSLVPVARLKDSNLDGTVDDGYFALSYAGAVEAR